MRTIKFRGKRLDNQEWEQGNYVAYKEDDGEDVHCIASRERNQIGASLDFVPVDPETVGQFTGELDDNGKEIYEGDVLEVWVGKQKFNCRTSPHEGCVVWNDLSLQWFVNKTANTSLSCVVGLTENTVIGNIHDNPELLTEK